MNHDNMIIGKEVGSICVSMFEENETGLPIFFTQSENKHMLPLSRVIENVLSKYD